METENTTIIKKAREIIMNEGISALTIHNLAIELKVEDELLHQKFGNEDDIIQLILSDFEKEINEYVRQYSNTRETAETELKLLFKRLFFVFLQNPFYLSIIFDSDLTRRNTGVKKTILRIRKVAENYLATIINAGKTENTFKTMLPTKVIVGKVLSDFRSFMNDDHLLNAMVLELKTLKTKTDSL
jgi:AcrR family transcriptional regulator